MNMTAIFINALAVVCLVFALIKDRAKTKQALKMAVISFFRISPTVLAIIIIIGLLSGFVPESQISKIVGEDAGFRGVLTVALLGAVLHIPSLISFPLAASLLERGASITSVAVFITTLTMIGMVTLPLEIRILGKKLALLRNGLSFIIAIIIGLIMGAIL
ncbi:permease [Palaeococcus pacificus DY20341]|uniref:Permease n=1 Tax=Palaeococcus pacificus DY20341 TaxID=1343739 RepID=A0A075LRJ9_9EURY|nr:permease [Palaeococcus pacificus]AIF68731.1 permease [Palaeococcus pacificus DY20341]